MKNLWIAPALIATLAGTALAKPLAKPDKQRLQAQRVAISQNHVRSSEKPRISRPISEQVMDIRVEQGMAVRDVKATWVNPKLGDPGVLERGGVPEGMMLVGPDGKPTDKLDPNKPTVIYLHGWTPDSLPYFPYAKQWNDAGWNTLLFRWHNRAHTSFLKANALAESKELTEEFCNKFSELRTLLDQGQLGSYNKEFRFVGYSLGAPLAINSAYKLFYQDQPYGALDWKMQYPRRIDLLEPAFVDNFMQADQVTLADPQGTVATSGVVNQAQVGRPRLLNGWGVKVTSFTSSLGRTLTPHLQRTVTTQQMDDKWTPTDADPNISDQHVKILDYYFSSIATPPASIMDSRRKALSARTPTKELPSRTQARLVQVAGQDTMKQSDDVYEAQIVETTRGGVLVDQNAFKVTNETLKNTVITFPIWQTGY